MMNEITQLNKTLTPKTPIKRALKRPDIYKEFIVWTSLFGPIREPKTQREFAEKFGVSQDTLTDWKKRDDFWDAVEREWKRWGREKTTNVMSKFYNATIQKGESANFRLWLQYFLNWREKKEAKIKVNEPKKIYEPAGTEENKNADVEWRSEGKEQNQANKILSDMLEEADKNQRIKKFLEEFFEQDWATIKERVSAEGSAWYGWWHDGVNKFIRMQKEKKSPRI